MILREMDLENIFGNEKKCLYPANFITNADGRSRQTYHLILDLNIKVWRVLYVGNSLEIDERSPINYSLPVYKIFDSQNLKYLLNSFPNNKF